MIWLLLLAHFLGDFLLQSNWMARRKSEFLVLSLHVGIHFILMVILIGSLRSLIWPYLLLITFEHFGQDLLKLYLTDLWPGHRVLLYFVDQLIHFSIIWGVVVWIGVVQPEIGSILKPDWAIIAIAYLIVTKVWYITERIMFHSEPAYLQVVEDTKFSRMITRSGMISIFALLRAGSRFNLAFIISFPYPASNFRKRLVISDLSISLIVTIFLVATLGSG